MDQRLNEKMIAMEKEIADINVYLQSPYDTELDAMQERLTMLSVYNARTGEMLADAEFILSKMKAEAMDTLAKQNAKMSANEQKARAEGMCARAQRLVTLIERANKATVHGSEASITQAYVEKDNMSLTRKGY